MEHPIVALVPGDGGAGLLVGAVRAGAAQVVPLPLQRADFLDALDCVAAQQGHTETNGQVVAVSGVLGGCGATTLAFNLAHEISRRPRTSCLLVEMTLQVGTIATTLDLDPPLTTYDLLSNADRLDLQGVRHAVTSLPDSFDVIVAPFRDIRPAAVPVERVLRLIRLTRRLASVVVLDLPCTFDEVYFETLAAADLVVLVGVQTVSGIRTLKLVRDTLGREDGIRVQTLVINRYNPSVPGFTAPRLAELLQVPRVRTVANDFPAVMAASNHGRPVSVAVPHSPVAADVAALARAILGDADRPAPERGLDDRLRRSVGLGIPDVQQSRPVRLLHVEDDDIQQHVVSYHLASLKEFAFDVVRAASEDEALATFRAGGIDVVLLDYHLSQGDGLNCLKQMRRLDPAAPIIVVSGVAAPRTAAELLEAGADDFLSKETLSPTVLSQAIHSGLARASAYRQRATDTAIPPLAPLSGAGVAPDVELLRCLYELQEQTRGVSLSAGQIQRLVDVTSGEWEAATQHSATPGTAFPRRAWLALLMRLLGTAHRNEARP